jgi:large subunit ribosomal protein L20
MARTKSTSSRRHRKVLKLAKGFKQARSRRYKVAQEAVLHAGQYAFEGRKLRRRNIRSLWIMRLNAAVREHGLSYSRFIDMLAKKHVELDRKILSDIAITDSNTFKKVIEAIK